MKYLLAICLCLFAFSLASAGEVEIIDPSLLPIQYPVACYEMSDTEFFQWAVRFNEGQRQAVVYSEGPQWIDGTGYRVNHVGTRLGLNVTREAYPTRFRNPYYRPPTSLRILNPYCKPLR